MFKQLIIASLAIASIAGAAQAQDTRTVKVSTAGIDTRSEGGALVMLHRIKFAAAAVCGPEPSHEMDRYTQYEPCVQGLTQRTVAQLNNPYLTALLSKSPAQVRQVASAR
jgi:UrcA family protein